MAHKNRVDGTHQESEHSLGNSGKGKTNHRHSKAFRSLGVATSSGPDPLDQLHICILRSSFFHAKRSAASPAAVHSPKYSIFAQNVP